MANAWIKHLTSVRKSNPGMSLRDAMKAAKKMKKNQSVIVNLSGRGDKDLQSVKDFLDKRKIS